MELKDFVKESLNEIAEGIIDAISYSDGKGYMINPVIRNTGKPTNIRFKVSVQTGTDGGVNIKIADISSSTSSVSTLEFEVPMLLPSTVDERREIKRPSC